MREGSLVTTRATSVSNRKMTVMTASVKVKEDLMTENEIVVRDGFKSFAFTGTKIADVSWDVETVRARNRYRWTDMILYRALGDGPYAYFLQTVGRSIIYHRAGGPCGRGVRIGVSSLYASDSERYDILEPCPEPGCKPQDLQHLNDDDTVAVEEDRYTLYRCVTVADIINALRDDAGEVSGLGDKLLTAARMADQTIRDVMATPERLQ